MDVYNTHTHTCNREQTARAQRRLWEGPPSDSGQGDEAVRPASDGRGRDGVEREVVGEQRDKRGEGIVRTGQNEVDLRQT